MRGRSISWRNSFRASPAAFNAVVGDKTIKVTSGLSRSFRYWTAGINNRGNFGVPKIALISFRRGVSACFPVSTVHSPPLWLQAGWHSVQRRLGRVPLPALCGPLQPWA